MFLLMIKGVMKTCPLEVDFRQPCQNQTIIAQHTVTGAGCGESDHSAVNEWSLLANCSLSNKIIPVELPCPKETRWETVLSSPESGASYTLVVQQGGRKSSYSMEIRLPRREKYTFVYLIITSSLNNYNICFYTTQPS